MFPLVTNEGFHKRARKGPWGRLGEVCGLGWEHVDFSERTLTVARSLQRVDGEVVFVEPKTKYSRRTVALPPIAVEALQRHQLRQSERRLRVGPLWEDHDLVFPGPHGAPRDTSAVTRRFQRLLKRSGLRRQRFHDLRHAAASLMLAGDVHPKIVQETLGHAQFTFTQQRYSHVVPAVQRRAAEKMQELLSHSG